MRRLMPSPAVVAMPFSDAKRISVCSQINPAFHQSTIERPKQNEIKSLEVGGSRQKACICLKRYGNSVGHCEELNPWQGLKRRFLAKPSTLHTRWAYDFRRASRAPFSLCPLKTEFPHSAAAAGRFQPPLDVNCLRVALTCSGVPVSQRPLLAL